MASSGNSTATLVNHLEYNAFGTITSQTNSAYQPLQTYTGQIQDSATGLLYYDARWYDPGVAQFVSEDPIGFAAGDANLRRYVGNSMPNAMDPTGLEESGGGSFLASMINGVSPGFGYLLERQQRAETMIGEAARSKYGNWKHHYAHGGRYRPGGIYGEYEGVAEAAAHMSLLGDSETMGLNIMRSGTFAYGFLLRRDEEAAQIMADIPKSRAENAIDAAKNYGREQFFGCLLEDETVMRDLEAGNAVGQDKFQIAATVVSTLVLEPLVFARLGSILNWVRSTATFRRLASIPGLRYLDDAARLATKSQVDEGLEWVDAPRGARGPATAWDGFDEALAGGPVRDLATARIKVTDRGISVVEGHIGRFGPDKANRVMVDRLRQIARGELQATPQDLNFYSHELREFVRYRRLGWASGVPGDDLAARNLWLQTHTASLLDYSLPYQKRFSAPMLYHPDAFPYLD